jgi:hypothetical protein
VNPIRGHTFILFQFTNLQILTLKKYCSAQIQNSTSRLPSRPWFVFQKWNPVGHGQEVKGWWEEKEASFFPPSLEARRVLCVQCSVKEKKNRFFC